MRGDPDVTRVQEAAASRVVHESKSLPGSAIVAHPLFQNRQKHDLMAALEKFEGKINVMEKRTAQVGHFPTEEEDFHCSLGGTIVCGGFTRVGEGT